VIQVRSDSSDAPPGTNLLVALLVAALAWTVLTTRDHVTRDAVNAGAVDRVELPDMRIDLNAASAAELTLLPGIGPALAPRIVLDREARGPFASVEDLDRVPGIGPATVDRVAPYVVAGRKLDSGPTPGLR
jgi:competence protein ComEA